MRKSHSAPSLAKGQLNSLGMAQANLEHTTNELRLAQAGYEKARERLTLAEEGHQIANVELMNTLATVRGAAKVVPTVLK